MPETEYLYNVPASVWRGERGEHTNTHDSYRHTMAGKILNLGPTQPYKSVTGEIRDAPFKYANVTGTPFDMLLNIIPGMHPFHWDLLSAVTTVGALGLGAADGVLDDSDAKAFIERVYRRHPEPQMRA